MVIDYIDGHRERVVEGKKLGVESICAVLNDAGVQIAPRTYWAAKKRALSKRALRDAELVMEIERVFRTPLPRHARGRCAPRHCQWGSSFCPTWALAAAAAVPSRCRCPPGRCACRARRRFLGCAALRRCGADVHHDPARRCGLRHGSAAPDLAHGRSALVHDSPGAALVLRRSCRVVRSRGAAERGSGATSPRRARSSPVEGDIQSRTPRRPRACGGAAPGRQGHHVSAVPYPRLATVPRQRSSPGAPGQWCGHRGRGRDVGSVRLPGFGHAAPASLPAPHRRGLRDALLASAGQLGRCGHGLCEHRGRGDLPRQR
ncbi:hypothetical protein BJY18_002003 [Amycolatopsis jiangsuensis]|uniref:Uncharacterized protein n=1 Tax=Amycolatopsis jiangsuensis TaxID=1181879 RepID=A0A840ITN4_9PSEU|nr:hypothetical protein [Amycolatopsis jiangsuensis]